MAQQPELDRGEDAPLDAAQATGRGRAVGRRVQRTVNFDQEVLDRARAAAAHLAAHAPEAGVRSLADIINPAVAERVAELEERFNAGHPFDPVFRLPAGRPRDRSDT
jgi:hypothetical protein